MPANSLKLAKIGLDQINACFERRLQERSRRIHDDLAARLFRGLAQPCRKNLPARRQASCRWRSTNAGARLRCARSIPRISATRSRRACAPGNTRRYCSRRGLVENRDILPRVILRPGSRCSARLRVGQQGDKQLSGRAAGRENRRGVDAEPFQNPGDVDSASTGIAVRRCAAHLGEGISFFTDVEMSTAGFMVRVTIGADGISANAFDLRQMRGGRRMRRRRPASARPESVRDICVAAPCPQNAREMASGQDSRACDAECRRQ